MDNVIDKGGRNHYLDVLLYPTTLCMKLGTQHASGGVHLQTLPRVAQLLHGRAESELAHVHDNGLHTLPPWT
jgi:hypothetical protein